MRPPRRMEVLKGMTLEELRGILAHATPDLFAPTGPYFPVSVRTSVVSVLE